MSARSTPPEPESRLDTAPSMSDTAAFDELLRRQHEDARAAPAPQGTAPTTRVPASPALSAPADEPPPMTRREARERAEQREAQQSLAWHHDGGSNRRPPRRPRSGARRAWTWILSTLVIIGLLGGGAVYAWRTFQPQVHAVMKHFDTTPTDYTGDGSGTVDVTVKQGDTGEAIAQTLSDAGVTLTSQAFYELLLQTKPDPVFQPGVYRLHRHMSAASALALLQDPKSHLERTLLIREGESEATVLTGAAAATGIPIAQLQAAAKSPAAFGLPAQAKSLEGFLFPATYTFDPGIDAKTVLTTLVDRAKQAFEQDGVPADKLWNTVILASIVQREAGSDADMPNIAGVFSNRLAQGMRLQSDATVAYGTGRTDSVWTTPQERADASNLYNTYARAGLPVGPIGNPGDAALTAALHPQGDYLYFTVVNLQTGKTAFAKTDAEHEANVAKLQEWCAQSGNASYCK